MAADPVVDGRAGAGLSYSSRRPPLLLCQLLGAGDDDHTVKCGFGSADAGVPSAAGSAAGAAWAAGAAVAAASLRDGSR